MAAAKLRQDFQELGTVPHSGLKGDEAARLVRRFLNDHLPKRFSAGSGFTIDRLDQISKQTDVVIYDALNCPVYRASDEAGVFPADNVAAVVEVKSRLDKTRLEEAFTNIAAAKSLAKTKEPQNFPFPMASQTLGCLFAFDCELDLDTLARHYNRLLAERGLGHHVDLIAILDRAVLMMVAQPPSLPWTSCFFEGPGGPSAEGSHLGVGVMELGEASLDGFLRFLLVHLSMFRGLVDHPGLGRPGQDMKVFYLTSITFERDPQLRDLKLQRYADEARAYFERNAEPGAAE